MKLIPVAILLLCVGCVATLPCKTTAYTSPHFAPNTHYVWCKGELNYCFDTVVPESFCARLNNAKPVNWHLVAVGTNVPAITKENDGYSFWIVCDEP